MNGSEATRWGLREGGRNWYKSKVTVDWDKSNFSPSTMIFFCCCSVFITMTMVVWFSMCHLSGASCDDQDKIKQQKRGRKIFVGLWLKFTVLICLCVYVCVSVFVWSKLKTYKLPTTDERDREETVNRKKGNVIPANYEIFVLFLLLRPSDNHFQINFHNKMFFSLRRHNEKSLSVEKKDLTSFFCHIFIHPTLNPIPDCYKCPVVVKQ